MLSGMQFDMKCTSLRSRGTHNKTSKNDGWSVHSGRTKGPNRTLGNEGLPLFGCPK